MRRKVTQEDIDALLDSAEVEEHTFHGKELVVSYKLVDRAGFTVSGRGAVVDPTLFDVNIGRQVARQDASNKLWQLEGYLLQLQQAGLIDIQQLSSY